MTTQGPRVAIITGAGSTQGIGFAVARLLGAGGCQVVITSTTNRIFGRVSELRAEGVQAEGVVADLTDQAGVDAVLACALDAFGGVDVLVNNAGMTAVSGSYASGATGGLSLHHWQASLDRNLTTTFLMTRAVVGLMQAAGYGRIVNVSSVSGPVAAYGGDVAYHAAKAGVVGLTRSTAIDTAAAGVTVNAVAPGWIDTASASDHERRMGAATPVGRSGTADEVAYVIAFLAGEGASYITGQLITVDGANSISEERGR
ncbi:3-oxoacyl-[acyl-carrier protein] reductase [Georgenia satyanarayanai]|uniref:3-oxoacyl-[acyl-carrier protein] reductase n=1 Tax=Georgenia satyanarayanai TaxID=860221 RepID=A0A2Y9ATG9_9MICO|nr:SDR family NAD(P)-dependent oxidoreductase [Georgenia satyanarayanai]PYF97799.1 3-oxoacyl-[acyl-carrier protein] reductase [Georgenia satyanarayanai]SSA45539.1 3-oxoacyl-[acyl-carrier protein] reductase [Georgenia satyanarayanai]